MNKLKIYLDNCCFNRPFDNQKQTVIEIETIAKLKIQHLVKENCFDLVWSFMSEKENDDNTDDNRKNAIKKWKDNSKEVVDKINDFIKTEIVELNKKNIHFQDAVHIACAIYSKCDYFITTDKKLLNKNINSIKVVSPIEFIEREDNYE